MKHPLKCDICNNYRRIIYSDKVLSENNKSLRITNTPFYKCDNCGESVCIISEKELSSIKEHYFPNIEIGTSHKIDMKDLSSVLDPNKKFTWYNKLGFNYDARDYYTIPGLYRPENDGYLTPVFFDKDVLLYYNNHPEYQVKLYSFSSGNIYYNGESLFDWGFGINRSGKIFKWLGDLENDFKGKNMKSHWKRFQASNISSDHDIYSKFYLSQNPFSYNDAFQESDNEYKMFKLKNEFDLVFKNKYSFSYSRLLSNVFDQVYKHPILNERNQIFEAYLSLNKFLVEGIDAKKMKSEMIKLGIKNDSLDGLGSLKTFSLFIEKVIQVNDAYTLMTPFFVLNDLRNLHGHLNDTSFHSEYKECYQRLGFNELTSDFEIYERLILKLINSFDTLIKFFNNTVS